jgi:uncharacterized protein (TIGR03437 family)
MSHTPTQRSYGDPARPVVCSLQAGERALNLSRRAWIAMLGGAAVTRAAARLARYPYIGNVRPDRATITWTTLDPGSGAVDVIDAAGSRRVAATMSEFASARTGMAYTYYQFRAELPGLRPATEYSYRILVDGAVLEEGPHLRFRTPGPGPFKFVAIGDSGQGTAEQFGLVPLIAEEQPALVIHSGDVVYPVGGWTEYQDFYFTPYEDLLRRIPFFLSLGNHDVMTASGEAYLALHAHPVEGVPAQDRGRYYSFDWGDVHFVALDSNAPLIPGEEAMQRMLAWLDQDLARSRQYWRIAFFHHPPFASGFNELDPLSAEVRARIVPLLEAHEVDLVINGHEHSYQRTLPMREGEICEPGAGPAYVTTGGGGAGLFTPPARAFHAARATPHHYLRVEVEDGRMLIQPIGLDRRSLDFVRLEPAPALSAAVNGASFTAQVAPGGLISLFGRKLAVRAQQAAAAPLPSELAGTRVSLNGRDLPLVFVSPGQVNAQLPFDARGFGVLRVTSVNGRWSDVAVNVADAAPAIFSVRAPGPPGQPPPQNLIPAIVHANGRLVTDQEPARAGEFVILYATGLGRVQGDIAAGQAAPLDRLLPTVLAVEVRVGGQAVAPAFAGLAPGFAGLYQVNVQLPVLGAGRQALEVVAGGVRSNAVSLATA